MREKYANEILEMSRRGYEDISHDFSQTRKVFWEELYFLGDYIKDGDKVLDIGCGNGRFLEVIKGKTFQYTGIDNSKSLISYAREWHGNKGKFICSDALSVPLEDASFNVAVSFGVLHHIPSKKFRVQFLNEAYRVLKKDGLLILTVWNLWNERLAPVIKKHAVQKLIGKSQLDLKDVFLPFGKKENVRYLHAFTQRELKKLLKKSGFKIEELRLVKRRSGNENILAICRKI
jgi:ubiquinone/menaquinone biosynthesis C-methylase UbiE